MTIAESAIKLDFLTGGAEETVPESPGNAPKQNTTSARPSPPNTESYNENEDIAEVFLADESEAEPTEKHDTKADGTPAKKPDDTPPLDPGLIHAAATWGIRPEEAQKYPNNEALRSVIRDRERLYGTREPAPTKKAPEPRKAMELPDFDLEMDEDADPVVAKLGERMKNYAASLKVSAEAEIKAMRQEIDSIRDESSAVSDRTLKATQVRMARTFDEEVASWDESFIELLGVPSQNLGAGSAQGVEVKKLNEYVMQMQAGYVALNGEPDPEVAVQLTRDYVRQGRHAIWPEMAQQKARKDVSKKLRNQKGGVGLRPKRSRGNEPPEQGDQFAKAAIGEFYADHGLDPWK